MDAPERIGLIGNGLGQWRLATQDEAMLAVHYVRAAEHDRMMAEKGAEIERLLKAISAIATWMDDPEWREHIGAVRGARSIARAAAIRALKESPDA